MSLSRFLIIRVLRSIWNIVGGVQPIESLAGELLSQRNSMKNESRFSAKKSILVFCGLFAVCFVFFSLALPSVALKFQLTFVYCHQIVGALFVAAGVGATLSHFTGKLPGISLGRALLLLFTGLAIFSMSAAFAIAAAAIYIADQIQYKRPTEVTKADES